MGLTEGPVQLVMPEQVGVEPPRFDVVHVRGGDQLALGLALDTPLVLREEGDPIVTPLRPLQDTAEFEHASIAQPRWAGAATVEAPVAFRGLAGQVLFSLPPGPTGLVLLALGFGTVATRQAGHGN